MSNSVCPAEVAACFGSLNRILERHRPLLAGTLRDHQRQRMLDDLGRAGSHYRQRIYQHGLSDRKTPVTGQQLIQFFDSALEWIEPFHSRPTGGPTDFIHAYNLVRFENRTRLPIRRLYEMLEGQVAVLSSGHLSAEESLEVLTALKRSAMYRADQHSYLLYPDRRLPPLSKKTTFPPRNSPLARCCGNCWLTATGNSSSATLPDEFTSTAPSPTPATSAASWSSSPLAVMPDW